MAGGTMTTTVFSHSDRNQYFIDKLNTDLINQKSGDDSPINFESQSKYLCTNQTCIFIDMNSYSDFDHGKMFYQKTDSEKDGNENEYNDEEFQTARLNNEDMYQSNRQKQTSGNGQGDGNDINEQDQIDNPTLNDARYTLEISINFIVDLTTLTK